MLFNHAASLRKPRLFQPIHKTGEDRLTRFNSFASNNSSSGGASTPVGRGMHEVFLLEAKTSKQTLQASQPAAETLHRFTMTISRYSLGTTIVLSSALFMRPMRSYRSFSRRFCCGTSSAENALSIGP